MSIIVTGDTGLLGPYLMNSFSALGYVEGVSTRNCDLTDEIAVKEFMSKRSPEMIVHAAALADVEQCALQPHKAMIHNCGMVENLVRYMPGDCRFIYISTDSIYSGIGPHREHSKSENPLNAYGLSKFMGEFAAAKAINYLIVRTSMYGKSRKPREKSSFLDGMITQMKSARPINLFTDVFFSPLWVETLALNLAKMARSKRTGTFNLGASTGMSKAKFAALIANGLGLSLNALPVESRSIPGRVVRPLDTRMDITRVEATFDLTLPNMESDIRNMCEHYKCTN